MEFLEEKGRIYAVDANGKLLAEVTFPDDGNTAVIDHTFVDESLRGQGTASKLLRQAVVTVIAAININMQVLQIETSSSYFTLQITIDETFLRNFLEY